ncbi:MAG: hypothetical protein IJO63_02990 [Bacilli bacterium]|nr:hypothetical protein [Bacilli bacterium]
MNKTEVLALLASCKKKALKALERTDLTQKQKKDLDGCLGAIEHYTMYVNNLEETQTEELKNVHEQFQAMFQQLKQLEQPISIAERKAGELVKVEKVIPKEKQKDKTQKDKSKAWEIIRNILATLGVAALVAILIISLRSCDVKDKEDTLDTQPGIEQEDERKLNINSIDVDNYEQLVGYASEIQKLLGEDTDLAIEDIMYAIRLANFDRLDEKAVFKDRDEVCYSTNVIGKVTSELGSDSIIQKDPLTDIYLKDVELSDIILCATDNKLSIDEFASAKTENGYDIYAIADVCIKGIHSEEENNVLFAKVFNDLLARKVCAFSITPDSPVSTYYALLGMYHQNSHRLLELTSGIGLTSVYGDGTRIDGYYGFTCVEELEAYLHVGNPNNVFYTDIIDQNITNYSQEENLGR